ERAATFTAVPGYGAVAMGASAVVTALVALRWAPGSTAWLLGWLVDAIVAVVVGSIAIGIKARRAGTAVFTVAGQKFALSFLPPVALGALLTVAFVRWDLAERLP